MSWLNLTRQIVSPKTTARRLTSLRGWAKWAGIGAILSEYIAPTPSRTIPHPIPEGVDGLLRMITVAKNSEQKALVALGGFVGCRIGESLSLTLESFDLHEMTVSIRGKGDKTRVVPVSDQALVHIKDAFMVAVLRPDHRLIGYQDRFARQIIKNLGLKAELKRPISSHDLRATFATAMLDSGANIRVVQELLGHSTVATTEIYTGVAMTQMREAVNFQ